MTNRKAPAYALGDLIAPDKDAGIEADTSGQEDAPGMNWQLSPAAESALQEVDANLRAAEQISGRMIFG